MPTVSRGVYRWLFQRGATLEDFADRLNHFWTFGLLLILACIISWKQGASKPIVCWSPHHFTDALVEYTDNVCWNSHAIVYPRDFEKAMEELDETTFSDETNLLSTMPHVMNSNNMGGSLISKMSTTVTLYQWLPVILCFQALLFKLPNIVMYIFHGLSGINFDKLSGLTDGYNKLNMNERELIGRQTGRYVYNWCKQFENCLPWRLLTLLWLVVKFLYCVNIIAQLCITDSFLKTTDIPIDNSTSYGDVIADNIFENNASLWKESPVFPRQVLCEFQISELNQIKQLTIQCHLPINEFNERIYMFLWVWLIFVALVTCLNLVVWLLLTLVPIFRQRYITRALTLVEDIDTRSIPQLELTKFADFVGEDGVMTLKLIGTNSSEHVVRDVVYTMWRIRTGKRPGYGSHVSSAHVPEVNIPLQHVASGNDNASEKVIEKI